MEILTGNSRIVPTGWKRELSTAFRRLDDLLDFVGVRRGQIEGLVEPDESFTFLVTRYFAHRIQRGDPADPLLLQVVPRDSTVNPYLSNEPDPATHQASSWVSDPVGDRAAEQVPGLLHKYFGRVLLVTTGACAIHCRYCFRQNFDYSLAQTGSEVDQAHRRPPTSRWGAAVDYIRADPTIREVILSGGDPLTLVDETLANLVDEIGQIQHVEHLRIHSRLPIVLPSRVTDELIAAVQTSNMITRVVVHANHARELGVEVFSAIGRLSGAGIPVLNQSVLLAGVNDSADAQIQLCEALCRHRVQPYYLHLLDQVQGAESYYVPDEVARTIHRQLASTLPGYAVPKLVREIEGASGKTPVV